MLTEVKEEEEVVSDTLFTDLKKNSLNILINRKIFSRH